MNNQKVVVFNDQEILCLKKEDGTIWVAIKPIVSALGLHADSAVRAIKNHAILSQLHAVQHATGADGKTYSMLTLPIEHVNSWLFSIDINKVKEEVKPLLMNYQLECAKVLYDHFFGRNKIIQANLEGRLYLAQYVKKLKVTMNKMANRMRQCTREMQTIDTDNTSQLELF